MDPPCGFPNIGNTCYINAALASLFSSTVFLRWLRSRPKQQPGVTGHMCRLADQFYGTTSDESHKEYHEFVNTVRRHPTFTMEIGVQNDAQEFILQLLDAICEENKINNGYKLIQLPNDKLTTAPVKSNGQHRLIQKMDKAWMQAVKPYGVFGNLINGQLIHQVKCGACATLSHTEEPFMCLSLNIPEEGKTQVNLEECFHETFKDEPINDAWTCEKCAKRASPENPAIKSVRIWRLPPMLVITIKRFEHDGHKRKTSVSIADDLEKCLKPVMCSASPFHREAISSRYLYCASVHHHGHAMFGHYIAMCNIGSLCKLINDDHVRNVCLDDIQALQNSSYVLVFETMLP